MSTLMTGTEPRRGPGGSPPPSAVRLLGRVRREWRLATLARGIVTALGVAAAVATLLVVADLLVDLPLAARRALGFLPLAAALIPLAAAAFRLVRSPDMVRTALLAEERIPGFGNALVTAVSARPEGTVGRLFERRLDAVIAGGLADRSARRVAPWHLRRPALFTAMAVLALTGLAFLAGGPASLLESWRRPAHEAPLATAPGSPLGRAAGDDVVRVTALRWTARSPAYAGGNETDPSGDEPIQALAGSAIGVRISVAGPEASWRMRLIEAVDGDTVDGPTEPSQRAGSGAGRELRAEDGTVAGSFTLSREVRGVELEGWRDGEIVARRVVPVVALADAPPTVTLETPAGDEVLATPDVVLPVRARAMDDHGVAELRLGWIRSRGSGESFAFEEGETAFGSLSDAGIDGVTGEARLDIAQLGLEPGDVLHLRAIATDRNDVTGPGVGVSATRVIRIAGEGEEHEVTLLLGAPPDVEERPVLSQRMIILMTEELLEEAPGMARGELVAEATRIAQEQGRLRARVGEILFARSTGGIDTPEELADPFGGSGSYAPHGHADHEHVEGDEEWDATDPEAVLEAASRATGAGTLEELSHVHDDAPVVAVNRELMGAYNAMWEAERALRQAAADSALPAEYRALEILQEVREGERVFVRGRVSVPPLDIAAARGTGELTGVAVAGRSAGQRASAMAAASALDEALAALVLPPAQGALAVSAVSSRLLAAGAIDPGTAALLSRASEAAAGGRPGEAAARLAEAKARLEPAGEMGLGVAPEPASDDVAGTYFRHLAAEGATGGDPAGTGLAGGPAIDGSAAVRGPGSRAGGEAPPSAALPEPFVFATARYASGDWDSAPLVGANLMHSLAQYTGIDVGSEAVVVDLATDEVFEHPFLFLTGHLPVRFTEAESRNLRQFVERGGLLFVDDHNHDIDAAFHRTATAELRRIFGDDALQPLPADHELYTAFFEFDDGPPTTTHELNGWGDGLIHEELHAVIVDGRIGVLYSNKDYASEWNYHSQNKRFQGLDNTRLGVNVLIYALTR